MTQAAVRPAAPARPATTRGRAAADRGRPVARRWPWSLALALYSAAVVVVVSWPSPVDAGAQDSLGSFFRRLHAAGAPDWVGYPLLEAGANVAMFVPLGFMVTRLSSRWWWGLALPAALSVGAELGQALLRPERFATAADVAANTGGAAAGTAAALLVMARGRSARTAAASRHGGRRHRAR